LVPDCGAIQKNAERCKNLTKFQKPACLWLQRPTSLKLERDDSRSNRWLLHPHRPRKASDQESQNFSGLMDAPVSRGMTLFLRVNKSEEILIRLSREGTQFAARSPARLAWSTRSALPQIPIAAL
jgi:hypothetical protein